jgi:glycosyl transferase family 25
MATMDEVGCNPLLQHIVYINLARRTDRRMQIEIELGKYGLLGTAIRYEAVDSPANGVGCTKSHLAVLKLARAEGWPQVLILEDDFKFIVSPEYFTQQIALLSKLSATEKYDVCMLSYIAIESPESLNVSEFVRIKAASTAAGYIVQQHYYDKLIELYEWSVPLLEKTGEHWNYINDAVWQRLQLRDKWIGFKQLVGVQRPSFSDNAGKWANYKYPQVNYNVIMGSSV